MQHKNVTRVVFGKVILKHDNIEFFMDRESFNYFLISTYPCVTSGKVYVTVYCICIESIAALEMNIYLPFLKYDKTVFICDNSNTKLGPFKLS